MLLEPSTESSTNFKPSNAPVTIIPMKNNDGVFSNLNAKPDIASIKKIGEYLDKPPSYSQAELTRPPTYQDSLQDDFDSVSDMLIGKKIILYPFLPKINNIIFLDNLEVGSGGVFMMHCLGSILLHVLGTVLGLILSSSYAGRFGSISGFGILLIIYSLTIENNPTINPKIRSGLSIFLFIIGYVIFMSCLFMYQRIVERAKEECRNNII